jgi:hypothetical protein
LSIIYIPVTSQIALNIKTISRVEIKTLELDALSFFVVFWILKFLFKSAKMGKTREWLKIHIEMEEE